MNQQAILVFKKEIVVQEVFAHFLLFFQVLYSHAQRVKPAIAHLINVQASMNRYVKLQTLMEIR